MIEFRNKGNFDKTFSFLKRNRKISLLDLYKYGERGVEALRKATPRDTGSTADSWYYEIVESDGRIAIQWLNSHVNKHVNIAVILQYGHGTGTGGWVEGRDYINPALAPVFDSIAKGVWEEVTK